MATSQMKKPETKTGTVSTLILWVLSSDSSYQFVIFIHKYVEVGGSPILECSCMASSTPGGEHTTQYILQGIGVGIRPRPAPSHPISPLPTPGKVRSESSLFILKLVMQTYSFSVLICSGQVFSTLQSNLMVGFLVLLCLENISCLIKLSQLYQHYMITYSQ